MAGMTRHLFIAMVLMTRLDIWVLLHKNTTLMALVECFYVVSAHQGLSPL
jgi:hypothetical protein